MYNFCYKPIKRHIYIFIIICLCIFQKFIHTEKQQNQTNYTWTP